MMKLLCILLCVSCILFVGCQKNQQISTTQEPKVSAVWETSTSHKHWKFVLLDNGTLSEVVRADNQHMILSEGGMELNGPDYTLRYIFGPCSWSYSKENNNLEVEVVIDDFYIKAVDTELRCMLVDQFKGPLSEDGKTWTPEWTAIMRYDPPIPEKNDSGGTLYFKKLR